MEQRKFRSPIIPLNSENEQNSSNSSLYQTEGTNNGSAASQPAAWQSTQANLTWDVDTIDLNNGSVPAVLYSSGAYPQGNPAAAGTGYGMPANNQQYTYGVPYNNYGNLPATMPNQYGNNGAEWQNGMAGPQSYGQRSEMNNRGSLTWQEAFEEYINTFGGKKELGKTVLSMQKDEHKSALKMEEFRQKQQFKQDLKERHYEIIEGAGTMMVQIKNGINQAANVVVFRCQLRGTKRYRSEDGKEFFRLILLTDGQSTEVEGALHDADLLMKRDGLKQTELKNYEEGFVYGISEGGKIMRFVWEELRKRIRLSYDREVPVMIPSKAGWHISEGHYRFYSRESVESCMAHEESMQYSFLRSGNVDPMKLLEQIQKIFDPEKCPDIPVLLYARLISLLGRILTDKMPEISFTIVGENAKMIASKLCSTFEADRNVISLDAECIGEIKKRIQEVRDTPMIIAVSNPNNRSTQNRMDTIRSIQENGMLDGRKTEVTFVYCIRALSEQTPLEKTVMVEETAIAKVEIPEIKKLFDLLQTQVVDCIEAYHGDMVQNYKMDVGRIKRPDERLKEECRVVKDLVVNSFRFCKLPEQYVEYIQNFLSIGEAEISRRMGNQPDIYLDLFKKTVVALTNGNRLKFSSREENKKFKVSTVCWDENYYYFDSDCMSRICKDANISSSIYVKQQLAEKGLIKLYGNKRRREMQTDIIAYDNEGNPKRISVTAIKRNFWDTLGGIELWERSKEEC